MRQMMRCCLQAAATTRSMGSVNVTRVCASLLTIPFEQQQSSRRSYVKIYTRTGDKGKTSLFTGERRPKNDPIFDCLGNTDELNSSIGVALQFVPDDQAVASVRLVKIQSTLLDIGSYIATPRTTAQPKQLERIGGGSFDPKLTVELEHWLDEMELELPPLKNFILPSGGKCASMLHLSRSICRRLERSLQPLLSSGDLDTQVGIYINRLSDFLFMLARLIAMREGKPETVYKKPALDF